MHIKEKYSWIKHIDFMLIDIILLVVAFTAAYYLKFHSFSFIVDSTWKSLLLITCMINLSTIFFSNPYSGIFYRRYYEDVMKLIILICYNFCLLCIVLYLLKMGQNFSREMILTMYGLYLILASVGKYFYKKLLLLGKIKSFNTRMKTLVVVTSKEKSYETLQYIAASDFKEYDIKGICLIGSDSNKMSFGDIQLIQSIDKIPEFALRHHIDDIFVAVSPSFVTKECYEWLVANGVSINLNIESMLGFSTDDQIVTHVGAYKSLCIGTFSFNGRQMIYLPIKRLFDITIGAVGCVILLPIMLCVKLSYLLNGDRDPVVYVSERVGLNGKLFKIYKFRTMFSDAQLMLQQMLKDEKYRQEWKMNQKFENDPRITKLGKILRKTSLDEIPQFINMLKGDMSLVGPRPLVKGELEEHNGLMLYNKVKPGITGWWGCNGRSNISYRERLELEYYYIKNCSLLMDVICIFRTIFAVLKKEGAA